MSHASLDFNNLENKRRFSFSERRLAFPWVRWRPAIMEMETRSRGGWALRSLHPVPGKTGERQIIAFAKRTTRQPG